MYCKETKDPLRWLVAEVMRADANNLLPMLASLAKTSSSLDGVSRGQALKSSTGKAPKSVLSQSGDRPSAPRPINPVPAAV